ncbi:secondary thiamine-phosphate synthase enzyme YjbQ [Acidomonas methanolica]|uniref:Secondary thiamine-phosphate synthase enzyme n=1 Tax=Acidomonas methanolica NBRC 104435 TaxID=1231351 RepID=A0A023D3N8_ACIMT|nr:secondary thiamine-phosphate synthase enzyme YjbQ [Acidomonas methanolica]MBU2653570.1 secondary thiamine-phosphate synthase enzyme YjbQ [Acidomonas methanolica]TCS31521.1 secondary thiamine-phosphate synthase enzyme [Acidomonas methanolica]GAJ28732.1 hypothetical protein Amme_036_020 [Acidomonas methanolica NBRC 104435]GBQ47632.1 hypothetical protein AA0498_0574 [Acidomonas methanolica]GEK97940.1 hypothetical protein AME01nite_04390 [Acidomonas methanolica NBRC 104435]
MRQALHHLTIETRGKGLTEITRPVRLWLQETGITTGLLTLWCTHTSASLTVQENADPTVRRDIAAFFEDLVPEHRQYIHDDEGPDDMPAHLRTMLTGVNLSIPVAHGAPTLGVWQGIYLFEHRRQPHRRTVVLHVLGD